MKSRVHIATASPLNRRTFLQGLGVGMSLPLLDAMLPAFTNAAPRREAARSPRRMIAIETNQGILPQFFFPTETGSDFQKTRYLNPLRDVKGKLTVFSGISHPEVDGGHQAEDCFLTAAPHPGSPGFRNSISLDQFAAERIGHLTRFPSLSLSVNTRRSISYTASGVQIPGIDKPSMAYRQLFLQGSEAQIAAQERRLAQGRSVLDSVGERTRQLERMVGKADRERLDQYFTSVRELEQRLLARQEWERRPKPEVAYPMPQDPKSPGAVIERTRLMFDLARLAVQTDSTRAMSVYIFQNNAKPDLPGVNEGTHPLTHHGNQPEKIEQLSLLEETQFKELGRLLNALNATMEGEGKLLDHTMVLYGTCMGSANAHNNTNLPVLLAGGGFRHGQHLGFDPNNNYPLPRVFVSMLQAMGLETDSFANTEGGCQGLELS